MMPILASIFDTDAAKGGALIVVLIAFGVLLRELRGLRSNAASEVRMQMNEEDRVAGINKIPQPLEIKAHVAFTPLEKHNELHAEFEKLRDQRRQDVSGLHTKIEDGLTKARTEIAGEFKEVRQDIADNASQVSALQSATESQTRQLHQLEGAVERLPEKIKNLVFRP